MTRAWLSCAAVIAVSGGAFAQSVEIGQLGEAQAYDAPILKEANRLDPALWQGTSARRAADLIKEAPYLDSRAIVTDLVKAAVFSGGVPPEGPPEDVTAYRAARLTVATALGQDEAVARFVKNDFDLAADPGVNADIALAAGNSEEACHIADGVSEGRSQPKWLRLRAFCHVLRDERAAAELSTELLESSGYTDPLYFSLMDVLTQRKRSAKVTDMEDDPLYAAMASAAGIELPDDVATPSMAAAKALDDTAKPSDRLDAFYRSASVLSDTQIDAILNSLASVDSASETPQGFDYRSALDAPAPQGTGQLYALLRSANSEETRADTIAELLRRAQANGAFARIARFLEPDIQILPSGLQAKAGTRVFAQAAVNRGDIGAMQGLYQNLNGEDRLQARVALASDALGNGFLMGPLGNDIDGRLAIAEARQRAIRDAVIALAMGAQISGAAAFHLGEAEGDAGQSVPSGQLLALEAVARRGSRAETALLAAKVLENGGPAALNNRAIYSVIASLNQAGLSDFAGRIAAEDFLSDLAE